MVQTINQTIPFGRIRFIHGRARSYDRLHASEFPSVCFYHRAMLCISAVFAAMWCPSVCLSRSWIMSKRIYISSKFFYHHVATRFLFFHTKRGGDISTGTPLTGHRMQVGYTQKWRFCSNSWLSKIAGRAKCQKHLPTTKLCI